MSATDVVTEERLDALSAAIAARINERKAATGDLASLTTTIKTSIVLALNELDADQGTLSALTTTVKTSLVAAINEVNAAIASATGIDDGTTSASSTWSSSKIASELAALLDSAPETLNTFNELAAALGDDPNFATTILTALGLRVRVDAAQAFDGTQQAQGRANLGIVYSTQDFASDFTTATA